MVVSLRMTKKLGGEAADWATKAAGYTIGVGAAIVGGAVGAPIAGAAMRFGGKTLLKRIEAETGGEVAGAGRIIGGTLRNISGITKAEGAARAGAGEIAKGVVEAGTKQTLGGAVLRGFGIARGAGQVEAKIRASEQADIEKAEKDLAGLSENALRTEYGRITATEETRAGIIKILGKKGKLKSQPEGEGPMTHDSIVKTLETVKSRGYNTGKEIESKYLWQYATEPDERMKAADKMSIEAFKEIAKEKEKDKDGNEQPSKFFDDDAVYNAFIQNATTAHLNILADPETNKDFANNLYKKLKTAIQEGEKVKRKKLEDEGKTEEAKNLVYTATDYAKAVK